jgi:uncharacterized OB-fold protein
MNAVSAQLWAAWEGGRLCFQVCDRCGRGQHPPGPVCSTCHSTALSLTDTSGDAELVAWSTVHRAPTPAFGGQTPYTLAIMRIPEGALIQVRTEASAIEADGWTVGQPGRLHLGTLNGRALPVGVVPS